MEHRIRFFKKGKFGKILTYNRLKEIEGQIDIKKFLREVLLDFAKITTDFFEYTDKFIFDYGELQLNSVLSPAIFQNSVAMFREHPVKRKKIKSRKRKIKTSGRVDYWIICGYKTKTLILMELKKSWQNAKTDKVRGTTLEVWKNEIDRINKIGKKEIEKIDNGGLANFAVKMVLCIIPTFYKCKNEDDIYKINEQKSKEQLKKIADKMKANWAGYWILNNDMSKPQEYENGYYSSPSVMFMAYVKDV